MTTQLGRLHVVLHRVGGVATFAGVITIDDRSPDVVEYDGVRYGLQLRISGGRLWAAVYREGLVVRGRTPEAMPASDVLVIEEALEPWSDESEEPS